MTRHIEVPPWAKDLGESSRSGLYTAIKWLNNHGEANLNIDPSTTKAVKSGAGLQANVRIPNTDLKIMPRRIRGSIEDLVPIILRSNADLYTRNVGGVCSPETNDLGNSVKGPMKD